MRLTEQDLMELDREATRAQNRARCLSPDELADVAAEEMSGEERNRLLDHLAACSDCADEYRIVSALKPWSEQTAATYAGRKNEVATVWRNGTGADAIAQKSPWRKSGFLPGSAPAAYAVAASLLIVAFALGAWLTYVRNENRRMAAELERQRDEHEQSLTSARKSLEDAQRRLEEASRAPEQKPAPGVPPQDRSLTAHAQLRVPEPLLNVPIIDLDPRGSVRGAENEATAVEVPRSASFFTMILNIAGEHDYTNYALEITDWRGRVVWRGRGLRKSQYNTSTLALPSGLFPPGHYQIKLYGIARGQRNLIQDYTVRISYR